MRGKAGIIVGGCAALVLAGASGAAALTYTGDEGRRVGTWHEAPGAARTPVAAVAEAPGAVTSAAPSPAGPTGGGSGSAAKPAAASPPAGAGKPAAAKRRLLPESATADGRQRVGELLPVSRLLGYLGGGPRTGALPYRGASYVKLHFSRMAMLPGDYLTVSNPDGTESYRYDAASVLDTGAADKW